MDKISIVKVQEVPPAGRDSVPLAGSPFRIAELRFEAGEGELNKSPLPTKRDPAEWDRRIDFFT